MHVGLYNTISCTAITAINNTTTAITTTIITSAKCFFINIDIAVSGQAAVVDIAIVVQEKAS